MKLQRMGPRLCIRYGTIVTSILIGPLRSESVAPLGDESTEMVPAVSPDVALVG
jgi:hypothetical protein